MEFEFTPRMRTEQWFARFQAVLLLLPGTKGGGVL